MIGKHVKRLLGIGTRIQPITVDDVETSGPQNLVVERKTESAVKDLIAAIDDLQAQSIRVRKLLLNDTLDLVVKQSGRTNRT